RVALTPAKLGQLEFPAELKLTMQWPQRGRQRRSPFDVFGMDDSFGSFFPDPFANYTDPTDVTIRSNTVALDVKPLPPNAPPVFSCFDPAKNKYVTVRSDPIAINVTGNAVAAAAPIQPGPASPTTAAAAAARATPKPRDILYQMTERGRAATFAPLFARPTVWT